MFPLNPVGFNFGIPPANKPPRDIGPPLLLLLVAVLEFTVLFLLLNEGLVDSPVTFPAKQIVVLHITRNTFSSLTADSIYSRVYSTLYKGLTSDGRCALVHGNSLPQGFTCSYRLQQHIPVVSRDRSRRARSGGLRRRWRRWHGHSDYPPAKRTTKDVTH